MPEFNVDENDSEQGYIEFDVYCDKCGTGICSESSTTEVSGYRHINKRLYTTCPNCIEKAYDDGYEAGHDAGYDEGYEKGLEDGRIEKE